MVVLALRDNKAVAFLLSANTWAFIIPSCTPWTHCSFATYAPSRYTCLWLCGTWVSIASCPLPPQVRKFPLSSGATLFWGKEQVALESPKITVWSPSTAPVTASEHSAWSASCNLPKSHWLSCGDPVTHVTSTLWPNSYYAQCGTQLCMGTDLQLRTPLSVCHEYWRRPLILPTYIVKFGVSSHLDSNSHPGRPTDCMHPYFYQ